ncbi:hypothetical protein BU23DRAFT_473976, partial [Bimuria novae-zelandiae CBS 107.79]
KSDVFWVHEQLLCRRSKFFETALNGRWSESDDKIVKLPEDDASILRLCLTLLYTGKTQLLTEITVGVATAAICALCLVYIQAEKLQDVRSRNQLIDEIHQITTDRGKFGDIELALPHFVAFFYKDLPESCPLRTLLVRLWICAGIDIKVIDAGFIPLIPQDFLVNLASAWSHSRANSRESTWVARDYYCPDTEPEKPKSEGTHGSEQRGRPRKS